MEGEDVCMVGGRQIDRDEGEESLCGQAGQDVELGLQQASFLWPGGTEHLKEHRFSQMGCGIQHVRGDELFERGRAAGACEVDPEAGVEQQRHEALS